MNVQTAIQPESLEDRAQRMCDDPAEFFGQSYTAMQSIPREEEQALQLAGLQQRFALLRDRVPMLKKLADGQGITELNSLEEAIPLLFEHTVYKSYPPSLLENGRFKEINRFLSRLTTIDISNVDVSHCETIDDWMETMDRETPLIIFHSSGTSGTMSFLPYAKTEWDRFGRNQRVTCIQDFGDDPSVMDGEPFWAIYPYFRHGGSGHVRMCENFVNHITGSEDRLVTAYPGRMSSDILYLAARIRAAQARGTLSNLKISPALMKRKAEYEALQAEMPGHLSRFFADISDRLAGKRVFCWVAQNMLFDATQAGLSKGLHHVFAPNSCVGSGGGNKSGFTMPDDWQQQVGDFFGVDTIKMNYAMSEVGAFNRLCSKGHYHFAPWAILYLLDPDTSKPLPREGRVTGRAAFYDLAADTRWGGFITGDELTVEWTEPCGCGQTTVWAEANIQRYSVKRGGDDKISCAATEGAHKEAMSFLVGE